MSVLCASDWGAEGKGTKNRSGDDKHGFYGLLLSSLPIWKACWFKRRKVELQIAGSSTPQLLIQVIIIIPLPSGKTLCPTADQLLQACLTAGQRLPAFDTERACKGWVVVAHLAGFLSRSFYGCGTSVSAVVCNSAKARLCQHPPTVGVRVVSLPGPIKTTTRPGKKCYSDNCSQMYLLESAKL